VKVICAWCVEEGRSGHLGDKKPLDDPAITHGICTWHGERLLETLPSVTYPELDVLVVVPPRESALYAYLQDAVANLRGVIVILERRQCCDRRRERRGLDDLRGVTRRKRRGRSLPGCTLVRFRRPL
jgi:hypothetical protein